MSSKQKVNLDNFDFHFWLKQWIQAESETARVLFSYESIEEDEISLTEGEVGHLTHRAGN